jgi:ribosomal protein S18 acetylase RimI-like enzyme
MADVDRIGIIACAAYSKYLTRIGRAPAPMLAGFATHIARNTATVIEIEGQVRGFMIAWPETNAYFIDNIAVEPIAQGRGLGRTLIEYAVSKARLLGRCASIQTWR